MSTLLGVTNMAVTRMSSREFNQDTSGAKNAAKKGPVIITDRGRPAHVLLTFDEYQKLIGGKTIVEMLAMPGAENIEFEPARIEDDLFRPAEFY